MIFSFKQFSLTALLALGMTAPALAQQDQAQPETDPVEGEMLLVLDVYGLYEEWAGADGLLSVDEWDNSVDQILGEQDVNLDVKRWDPDNNGIISPFEFRSAIVDDQRFDGVLE